MKSKRDVKQELRKIDETFSRLEHLSSSSGFDLDDFMLSYNFPDIGSEQRKAIFQQSQRRQRVFELSQNPSQRKSREKVPVRRG